VGGEAQAREVLAQWYAAWDRHDVAGISALLTEDVVYKDPSAHKPILNGRREVGAYAAAAFGGSLTFGWRCLKSGLGRVER
jgi:ketosteroid isomerase-like protein